MAAKSIATVGNWGIFVETNPKPKTCWIATKVLQGNTTGQDYFFAVSRFRGKPNPQVSLFSNKRLPKSVGLFLEVKSKTYHLKSDGFAAWTLQKYDKRIVKDLYATAAAQNHENRTIIVGLKGVGTPHININGFAQALDMAIKECGRP